MTRLPPSIQKHKRSKTHAKQIRITKLPKTVKKQRHYTSPYNLLDAIAYSIANPTKRLKRPTKKERPT